MKVPKHLLLTAAALAVAGMVGLSYSQSSSDYASPPATTNPTTTNTPSQTDTQSTTNAPPMRSDPNTSTYGDTTPSGRSATMGDERVARFDRN